MKGYLLDTSALLNLRDDEPGAAEVAAILTEAQEGRAECYGCFMSLMEVLYRIWRDEDERSARIAFEQCQSLPMTWVHESPVFLEKAAEAISGNSHTSLLVLSLVFFVAPAVTEPGYAPAGTP